MKKIIHIDNSEFFRKLVKNFLNQEGFEAESFANAEEAAMAVPPETLFPLCRPCFLAPAAGHAPLPGAL